MWFDLLTFAVPMNVGSLEGSRILLFKLFSIGSPVGMAYGLALRLAQLLWTAIGLASYAALAANKDYAKFAPFKSAPVPLRTQNAIVLPNTKAKTKGRITL